VAEDCISNSLWEPKEEEKVEKLYTTGQMIDLMLENKKRRAWLVGERGRLGTAYWTDNHIMYGGGKFLICEDDNENQWRIIEPEPKKVSFVEAYKAFRDGKTIRGKYDYHRNGALSMSDEEIDGMWIILD
jgi:hypothetical protein